MGIPFLCLRCRAPMKLLRTTNLLTRDNEPLFTPVYLRERTVDEFLVDLYCCPECGHIELFRHDGEPDDGEEDVIEQTVCPACGKKHDIDYPKCPFCGHKRDV